MKRLAALVAALLLSLPCLADTNVFMVYGRDFTVGVPLPDSWTVDMEFARSNELNGFFYPKQYELSTAPVAILLTLATKPSASTKLAEYIQHDLGILTGYYEDYSFAPKSYRFSQQHDYAYRIFEMRTKDGTGHYQLIAYLDCGAKYFVKLYIDCKNLKVYEEFAQTFLDSVKGLSYLNTILKD